VDEKIPFPGIKLMKKIISWIKEKIKKRRTNEQERN
jgi:hypothetical protein